MKEFPIKYKPSEVEKKWQDFWDKEKVYSWDSSFSRENTYVIDTPPPTVSGLLHMGHIFSYTQTDIIARFQRMNGKTVFYPMGFDDNGLPTERLVEKIKKVRAASMERADFIALCKEVVKDSENDFRSLFKSIALSVDWQQEYQTISDNSKKISQMSFLDLLEKNEAYRQQEPVLWDPIDRTALSQADIEDKEITGCMNYIKFQTSDNKEFIIATTRPELLPACVAIFAHPEDSRYKDYLGKEAITPLFGTKIPILADDTVDMEKGSGIVMCCTFGDTNDVYWWKKYKLDTKMILSKAGLITELEDTAKLYSSTDVDNARKYAKELEGLKVIEARKVILEIIKNEGLLVKQVEMEHSVKCAERSKAPIEILITPQWFVKVLDKKAALIEKANICTWHPKYMKDRLESWINGLNWDWCISRQRYFGVPFPVWYSKRAGEEGKILLPTKNDLPIDPMVDLPNGYSRDEVNADCDVMDTWATSSLSPQLNSRAINDNYAIDIERHKKLYPADLRPQAHEIIRTWTFSTIVKSLIHENSIPWKNLMISGWCLAADKTKMSKSKGNVVTPIKLIEEKSADTIRYWTATSKLGSDITYSEETLSNGKRLINKLWNASKFVKLHMEKLEGNPINVKADIEKGIIFEEIDRWILVKLESTIEKASKEYKNYEYSLARQAIENFFWKDFCDNFLEISKTRLYDEHGENPKGQQSAIYTIHHCLKTILLLFAPIIPHITEEIYNILFVDEKSIHTVGTWPKIAEYKANDHDITAGDACIAVLDVIRKVKAEKQVSIKTPITKLIIAKADQSPEILKNLLKDLANVSSSQEIVFADKGPDFIATEDNKLFVKVDIAE